VDVVLESTLVTGTRPEVGPEGRTRWRGGGGGGGWQPISEALFLLSASSVSRNEAINGLL